MALFLMEVFGIFLSVCVFPGCILIYIIKNALESEEPNLSYPLPIDENYCNKFTKKYYLNFLAQEIK